MLTADSVLIVVEILIPISVDGLVTGGVFK